MWRRWGTYTCTIKDNHMMFGSWDIEHDWQIFLSFWTIFCSVTPLKTKQIKIFKKWKKPWRYYHFTHVYHKWQSYEVWFLRYTAWQDRIFCIILDCFLSFYPPNNLKNQTFEKLKKMSRDVNINDNHVNHKWQSHNVWFLRYGAWRTEFLSFWTIFCPFIPLKTQKIKI